MKSILNDTILAESDDTKIVEGNHYFPPESVNKAYLQDSDTEYTCPWKGEAKYYHVNLEGEMHEDAAWEYPDPKPAAEEIAGYMAFGKEVKVVE